MIPLFTSTFSIKSILTLEKPNRLLKADDIDPEGPDSIFEIIDSAGLKQLYLVESTMIGFKKAMDTCDELGIQLVYGVKINVCNNRNEEDKKSSAHKVVIFAKNSDGCRELMKLYSTVNSQSEGFADCDLLKSIWSENLLLAIPFYDSFIYKNSLYFCHCIPDFSFANPILFLEENDLPVDKAIREKVKNLAREKNWKTEETKTILYKERKDFEPYMVYRIATNRIGGKSQTLDRPELPGCGSKEFCWESYVENR